MFNVEDVEFDAGRDYRNQLIKYKIIQERLERIKADISRVKREQRFCQSFVVIGIAMLILLLLL